MLSAICRSCEFAETPREARSGASARLPAARAELAVARRIVTYCAECLVRTLRPAADWTRRGPEPLQSPPEGMGLAFRAYMVV